VGVQKFDPGRSLHSGLGALPNSPRKFSPAKESISIMAPFGQPQRGYTSSVMTLRRTYALAGSLGAGYGNGCSKEMDEVDALRKWMQEGNVREPTDVYKSSLKVSVRNRYYTMMKERSY
jgi:hypothetical protein